MVWMEGDVVKAASKSAILLAPVPCVAQEKSSDSTKLAARLRAVIQVNTTLGRWAANYELLKEAHNAWDGWMERINNAAPATMNGGLFTSPETGGQAGAWVFMDTQEMLVSGVSKTVCSHAIDRQLR